MVNRDFQSCHSFGMLSKNVTKSENSVKLTRYRCRYRSQRENTALPLQLSPRKYSVTVTVITAKIQRYRYRYQRENAALPLPLIT